MQRFLLLKQVYDNYENEQLQKKKKSCWQIQKSLIVYNSLTRQKKLIRKQKVFEKMSKKLLTSREKFGIINIADSTGKQIMSQQRTLIIEQWNNLEKLIK